MRTRSQGTQILVPAPRLIRPGDDAGLVGQHDSLVTWTWPGPVMITSGRASSDWHMPVEALLVQASTGCRTKHS